MKGGQSSCRGGDRSGARLGRARSGRTGSGVFFSPDKWSVGIRKGKKQFKNTENPVVSHASAHKKNCSRLVIRHESLYKEMKSNSISFWKKDSFFLFYDLLSGSTPSCIKVNPQLCVGGEIKSGHFAFLLFSLSCRDRRGPKCTNREREKAHHLRPPSVGLRGEASLCQSLARSPSALLSNFLLLSDCYALCAAQEKDGKTS